MFIPELFGLLYSVPWAVNDADASFFDMLYIFMIDSFFSESWKDDTSEFLFFVFDAGQ